MSSQIAGYFIVGITEQGNKFRPSDWIERIASVFASFDVSQRIRYSPLVMPVRHHDQPSLFVAAHLAGQDPAGYHFIMDFARSNQLLIKSIAQASVPAASPQLLHVA